jgi:hypothetical protein
MPPPTFHRQGTNEVSRIGIQNVAGNASVESTSAYIKQPNTTLPQLRRTLYDQYEVGGGWGGGTWARGARGV